MSHMRTKVDKGVGGRKTGILQTSFMDDSYVGCNWFAELRVGKLNKMFSRI